jgi:regulatory protein YycI of two-component signal transduction system YycFG
VCWNFIITCCSSPTPLLDPPNVTLPLVESSIMGLLSKEHHQAIMRFNLTHLFVFIFCGIIVLISVFLVFQYIFRYHRYQLAKSKEEADSPLNTPHGSTVSLTRNPLNGTVCNLKAVSTSTLMSEVVTLVKLKPPKKTTSSVIRHQKLRESVVSQDEDLEKSHLNDSIDSIGVYSK